jgi:hypothetical protein
MQKITYEELEQLEQLEQILEKIKCVAINIVKQTNGILIDSEKAIITISDCNNITLFYRDKDEHKQLDMSLIDLYIISDDDKEVKNEKTR